MTVSASHDAAVSPVGAAENRITVRVSYAETDQMGVVYAGWYVRWLEIGRTEYLRARGKTYKQCEEAGLGLAVVDLAIRYRQPAHYDDLIVIATRLDKITPARLFFSHRILRQEDQAVLATATSVVAATNTQGKAMRVPAWLRELVLREPMG